MYHQAGIHIEKLGRKNADPLVAPPGHSRNYDAAQSTVIDQTVLQFKKRRGQVSMQSLLFPYKLCRYQISFLEVLLGNYKRISTNQS